MKLHSKLEKVYKEDLRKKEEEMKKDEEEIGNFERLFEETKKKIKLLEEEIRKLEEKVRRASEEAVGGGVREGVALTKRHNINQEMRKSKQIETVTQLTLDVSGS